jgi:prepilin-type N-terminal cleavage/methylation domain-containing protein
MKNALNRTYKGFTIIEVMIVLAIAGLIMVIVFFAIPQLQRNQRDNSRQSTTSRLKAELETYASNNQGLYPFAGVGNGNTTCNSQAASGKNCGDWFSRYISGGQVKITDPSTGNDATIIYTNATTRRPWAQGNIWIHVGSACNGEDIQASGGTGNANSKQYAMVAAMDRNNTFFCVDNG